MYKALLLVVLSLCIAPAYSQSQDEILAEGWLMYHSERASWLGTDIFMEKFPEKRDKIGGYLSYTEGQNHRCIFFDKQDDPEVLAAITFDESFVVEVADINTDPRKLNEQERELNAMRTKALEETYKDTELFKRYENTSYNYVPLIIKGKKKVYILTGPSNTGVVIFGNDYLITFDKKNTIISKKQLHNNIIPIEYGEGNIISTIHSHKDETGDLITATDICTLLLYGPYASWQSHYVISDKNVSIWNCQKEELVVMTRKAWDRINEHQQKEEKE